MGVYLRRAFDIRFLLLRSVYWREGFIREGAFIRSFTALLPLTKVEQKIKCYFHIFALNYFSYVVNKDIVLSRKTRRYFLRIKVMLNFALSSIPKGGKYAPSIYSALKSPILNINDSLTSEEFNAKNRL